MTHSRVKRFFASSTATPELWWGVQGAERLAGVMSDRYANPVRLTTSRLASAVVTIQLIGASLMKTQINQTTFSFDSSTKIRAIQIDGSPWFAAIDVCNAIGISNNRDALRKLDDDERIPSA